jgi:hypothetical protein
MTWRRIFFFIYLIAGTALFLFVAGNFGVHDVATYFKLATGQAKIRHVRVVRVMHHWNQSVMHSGTDWNVTFTGGPLGKGTETLTLTQSVKKLLTAPRRFHIGSWIPVVYLQGQWLPLPDAKLNGTLGVPVLSLMALAVWGMILRGVVGPRAFPEHYEPALADHGPNVTGFPTRRPLVIVCVLLGGFVIMVWQIFFKAAAYLGPGAHGAYWVGTLAWTIFLISLPVVFWAALPRLGRVHPQ